MITLVNVDCGYGHNKVLKDVNLNIRQNELTCILAKNGIGKTTLFKSILGLLPTLGGNICFNGINRNKLTSRETASFISYVPQAHGTPFPFSVLDVVVMGQFVHSKGHFGRPQKHNIDAALDKLRILEIEHLAHKNFSKISGGEKQMVLIARAMAQKPKFIALDEPTANLDVGNSIRVMKVIRQLSEKGYGIIMNTHSPDQALQFADKVIMLQKGGVMKVGTPEETLQTENVTRLYKTPVELVETAISDGSIRKVLIAV